MLRIVFRSLETNLREERKGGDRDEKTCFEPGIGSLDAAGTAHRGAGGRGSSCGPGPGGERRSVAWDLFQYGQEVLEKVSQPSYSFTVDSADFLVMDEFEAFKNALSLGKRVYLELDDGRVLTPLLLGFSHTFDEKSGLTLEFSNKFTSSNENDRLVDLLEQSVSMGKKLDLSREVYSAFVDSHANTAIHDFMNGALDVAKNMVMSSVNQAITWDENGLRLRKRTEDGQGYDPHQVWMMNENIVFTDDGWQTAKMAIGHIVDPKFATEDNPNGDLWGVAAPNLIGNKLIGKNCAFYGNDPSGQEMSFQFDAQGLYSYNARQLWRGQSGSFAMLDPDYGFMLGTEGNPLIVGDDGRVRPSCIDEDGNVRFEDDTNKNGIHIPVGMNLYMDKTGKLYTRGDMFASNFCFIDGSGDVKTILSNVQSDLDTTKKMSKFDLSDVDVIDLGGMILDGRPGSTGIRFTPGYEPVKYQFSTSASGPWHSDMSANDKYRRDSLDGGTTWGEAYQFRGTDGRPGSDATVPKYITETIISKGVIAAPQINANDFAIYPNSETDYTGSFSIYGQHGSGKYLDQFQMLEILYQGQADASYKPEVSIRSPGGSVLNIESTYQLNIGSVGHDTNFYGKLNFQNATTTGLHFTLA